MRKILVGTLLLLVPCGVEAQARAVRDAGLPASVEARLLDLLDAPDTRVRSGPGSLDASEHLTGALFVEGGPFTVAGRVEGDVVMVGGELILDVRARVDGEVVVVNGSLSGEVGRLAAVSLYRGPQSHASTRRAVRRGHASHAHHERDVEVDVRGSCRAPRCRTDAPEEERWDEWDRHVMGDMDLTLRVDESYNRVEGLPLLFGPVIRTGGRNPLRVEALGIWRSVHGDFDTDDMGYLVRAEQDLLGGRMRLGASARSTIDAIESWQLTDLESSLASALFHSDRRDWYAREGWAAHATVSPRSLPVTATLEYRDEEHGGVPVRDPWALAGGDWRAQPRAAEGSLRSLVGSLEIDTRDASDDPYTGGLVSVRLQHALDADLTLATGAASAVSFDAPFTSVFLDARRYLPVGHRSTLALRGVAGGAVGDAALPPQMQHALGGVGSLPGYHVFQLDCGARAAGPVAPGGRYPAYGCDRMALLQAEYRGGVEIHLGEGWDDDDHWDIDFDFDWAFFFDAGRGWALEEAEQAGRVDSPTLLDAGAGLLFGDDLGLYWAVPLSGDGGGSTFFVRLQRRF